MAGRHGGVASDQQRVGVLAHDTLLGRLSGRGRVRRVGRSGGGRGAEPGGQGGQQVTFGVVRRHHHVAPAGQVRSQAGVHRGVCGVTVAEHDQREGAGGAGRDVAVGAGRVLGVDVGRNQALEGGRQQARDGEDVLGLADHRGLGRRVPDLDVPTGRQLQAGHAGGVGPGRFIGRPSGGGRGHGRGRGGRRRGRRRARAAGRGQQTGHAEQDHQGGSGSNATGTCRAGRANSETSLEPATDPRPSEGILGRSYTDANT